MIKPLSKWINAKNALRFFVGLSLVLALLAGLWAEKYGQLQKRFADLQKRHDRLNRIYLQEKQR